MKLIFISLIFQLMVCIAKFVKIFFMNVKTKKILESQWDAMMMSIAYMSKVLVRPHFEYFHLAFIEYLAVLQYVILKKTARFNFFWSLFFPAQWILKND